MPDSGDQEILSCPVGPSGDALPSCWDVPAAGTGSINIDGQVTYLTALADGGGGQIDDGEQTQLFDVTLFSVDGDTDLDSVWLMVILEDGQVTGVDAELRLADGQGRQWSYAPALGDDGDAIGFGFSPGAQSDTRLEGRFSGALIGDPAAPQEVIEIVGKLDVCVYGCTWPTD